MTGERRAPRNSPPGWLALADAFVLFGAGPAGRAWFDAAHDAGAMAAALDGELPPCLAIGEGMALDSEGWLRLYAVPLARCFISAVLAGRLQTAYALPGSLDIRPMPPEWWNTEDFLARFRSCRVDPAAPYVDGGESWVFVNAEQFNRLVAELGEWRASLPQYEGQDIPLAGLTCRDERGSSVRIMGDPEGLLCIAPPIMPDFGAREAVAVPSPANDGEAGGVLTGDPGRPELGFSLYVAEFERRAGLGIAEPVLADEADALHKWFREEHSDRQAPTAKTIRNRIRAAHRDYRLEATK